MTGLTIARRLRKYQHDLTLAGVFQRRIAERVPAARFANVLRGDNLNKFPVDNRAQDYFESIKQELIDKNNQPGVVWQGFLRAPSIFNQTGMIDASVSPLGRRLDLNETIWALWWFRYAGAQGRNAHDLTGIKGYHFVVDDDPVPMKDGHTVLRGVVADIRQGFLAQEAAARPNVDVDDIDD